MFPAPSSTSRMKRAERLVTLRCFSSHVKMRNVLLRRSRSRRSVVAGSSSTIAMSKTTPSLSPSTQTTRTSDVVTPSLRTTLTAASSSEVF